MRRRRPIALLFVAAAGSVFATGHQEVPRERVPVTPTRDDPVVLILAEPNVRDHPATEGSIDFAARVFDGSRGRIQVRVVHRGVFDQPATEGDIVGMLRRGDIALARVRLDNLLGEGSVVAAVTSPFVFDSPEHMWSVLDGPIGEEIENEIAPAFVVLGWSDLGAHHIASRGRAVRSIADLAGLPIVADVDASLFLLGRAGANVTESLPEPAPQLGAWETAASDVREAYNFVVLSSHARVPGVLAINSARWDTLDDETREILRTSAREASVFQRERWRVHEHALMDGIAATHGRLIELSPIARREFVSAAQEGYMELSPTARELIARIQAANR